MATVFNKMKEQAGRAVDEHRRKQTAKKVDKYERIIYEQQKAQARIEAEQKALEEERLRLTQMDQHELLAEAIMALRGFYSEFQMLKAKQRELKEQIDDLEEELVAIRRDMPDED